jgi:hypothetical protein
MKPTDAMNSNFIGITTVHVSGSPSAHHQEFLAVHRLWYMFAELMTVCYKEQDGTEFWFVMERTSILLLVANGLQSA